MSQTAVPRPRRRTARTLALALFALVLGRPAAADAKAEITNASGAAWSLVLIPNGLTTGGALKVGDRTLKPWDVERIDAGATKKLVFSYVASYAVRIRLVDSRGDWVDYRSDKGATERFEREGSRWQPVVWNHSLESIANLPKSVVTDVNASGAAAKGNIRILKDTLEEGGQARAGAKAPFPHVASSNGLAQASPCGLAYLFNRSGAAYTITPCDAPNASLVQAGTVVFADLNGSPRKESRLGPVAESFKLNPGQGILLFAVPPDKVNACHRFFSLADARDQAVNFEVRVDARTGGAALQLAHDNSGMMLSRATLATSRSSEGRNLELDPSGPVLTIIRDAYPAVDEAGTRKRR